MAGLDDLTPEQRQELDEMDPETREMVIEHIGDIAAAKARIKAMREEMGEEGWKAHCAKALEGLKEYMLERMRKLKGDQNEQQ